MKKFLIALLSIFLLMSSTITVFAEDTATITIDLNGGTVSPNGVPAGWTDIGEGKYSKDYSINESVNLSDEWSNYKPTKTDYEFDRWADDNWAYWDGFQITEDITVKAIYIPYLYVIMNLKGGSISGGSAPSGWEKVSGQEDQYRKKFLKDTYVLNITSEWDGIIPQYSVESGIGFVEWDYSWYYLDTDNSVIEAKTDSMLNVIFDLKGGFFGEGNVPTGWTKDSSLADHYIKKYVKGTSLWTIQNELADIVPQYSTESGIGFAGWNDSPGWYYLENDNSVIEAKVGALKTVTVDFDGGTLLTTNSTWTQDLVETDKYTKKFPVGYSISSIYTEISSSFSVEFFDGNRYFADTYEYDYSVWELPDNDNTLFTAKYVNAISIKIGAPSNGTIIVNDEQKNSDTTLTVPGNVTASCYNGVLNISSYSPNVSYKIESYGSSGYEFDCFTYNGSKFDSYASELSNGDIFSATMKAGSQKYPIWIDGVQLSEGNTTLLDGTVSYDHSTRVLTLDGANIIFSSPSGIAFSTAMTINVVSNSSITAVESGNSKCAIAGIYSESAIGSYEQPSNAANLNIVGNGKLTIDLKKTDGASFSYPLCVEGIFANKVTISTDVDIISDAFSNAAMNNATFYGINSGDTDGTKVNNGKKLSISVKSVSSNDGMPKCNLIGGPLTIDENAYVELSVGSFSSYNSVAFSSGTNLIAGTVSVSANPVGSINILQAPNLKTIDGATAGATVTDTSFTQASASNPLVLSTKNLVVVEGVSMTKTEFKSNETVEYSGSPIATKKADSTVVTSQIDTWNYIYYKESEEGSNIWNKLSSVPTDEGSYKLVVEAQDSEYFGKLELPFTVVHAHSFTYTVNSENETQLIATCAGTNCEYHTVPLTLTLTAPSLDNLIYDGTAKEMNFGVGEANIWATATESSAPTIEYYLEDGSTKTDQTNSGASAEGFAPVYAGTYKAKATVDTNKTAILEFSISPKIYQIIEGANSEWKKANMNNLIITSDAPFDEFICVKVDNIQIDNTNYNVESGSTKVTLFKAYLDTLSIGTHSFEIISKNGSITTTIKITNNDGGNNNSSHSNHVVPNTGVH